MNSTESQGNIIFIASDRADRLLAALHATRRPVEHVHGVTTSKIAQIQMILHMVRRFRRTPKPVLVMVDFFGFYPMVMLLFARWFGIKTALRIRGDFWHEQTSNLNATHTYINRLYYRIKLWGGSYLTRQVDWIFPVSEPIREKVLNEVGGIDPARIVTVPIYVSMERLGFHQSDLPTRSVARKQLAVEPGKTMLLTVTAMKYYDKARGLLDLANVFDILAENNHNLVWIVAGDGRYRKEIEKQLQRELAHFDQVRFIGHVPSVAELYRAADIFVYYSYFDSIGNILLEASLCKLPIVVNDYQPLVEFVRDGETGIVVPSNDPEAASTAVANLLASPQLRKTLATNAYLNVTENYSPEAVGRQIAQVLHRIEEADTPIPASKMRMER